MSSTPWSTELASRQLPLASAVVQWHCARAACCVSGMNCSTVEANGADHAVNEVKTVDADPGCWAPESGLGPALHLWQALAGC